MGIRNLVQSMRDRVGGDTSSPLTLTDDALKLIQTYIEGNREKGDLAFRVATVPTEIGFSVKVAFEVPENLDALRPEFAPATVLVSPEDWVRLDGYTVDVREGRFVTFTNISVHVSETPNPDSRKFEVNRPLVTEGSATFTHPGGDDDPALIKLLFQLPDVKQVFLINDSCSVTKVEDADWDTLQHEVGKRLQAYFAHGGQAITPPPRDELHTTPVEAQIIEILEKTVRPAVQRDGGDIAFAGFDVAEGRVQLYMLGSCVGCPSSMATLKMGVERLLKEAIPEVREVVAIN